MTSFLFAAGGLEGLPSRQEQKEQLYSAPSWWGAASEFMHCRSCIITVLGHREQGLHQMLPRDAGKATEILDWLIPGHKLSDCV